MSKRSGPSDIVRLWRKLVRYPKNIVATILLIVVLLVAVGIVNYTIWNGKNDTIRLNIAQTLEADASVGILAVGIFLIVFELWKRWHGTTNGPQQVEIVVRYPDGTLAAPVAMQSVKPPDSRDGSKR
ncbi:MAG TPA: hypothetical protein VGG32_10265 [Thermoplasmata archaeon]